MHNGYQIDPHSNLILETLFDLKESNGRIEQRLDDGKEFHHEVRETLRDYGGRLIVLEQKDKGESSFSTVLGWFEILQRIWPLLFLITTLAGAVGLHVPAWVNELSKHSTGE